MESGKNEKRSSSSSSSSQNPEEQQSPQKVQSSPTQQAASLRMPDSTPPAPQSSQIEGGSPSSGGGGGGGGMHNLAIAVGGGTGCIASSGLDAAADRKMAVGRGGGRFVCATCGKVFANEKSLFGHLRSHRGSRNWKGAFPPPTFSREEFADTGLLNPERGEEGDEPQVQHRVAEANAQPQVQHRVPDLNLPPPQKDNQTGSKGAAT